MSTTLVATSAHDPNRRARLAWIAQVMRQPLALTRQGLRAPAQRLGVHARANTPQVLDPRPGDHSAGA